MKASYCIADDRRLTKVINEEEDLELFQGDLEKLYKWAAENNMAFNGSKFEVLLYGCNEDLKCASNYMTPGAEDTIDVKSVLRDLEIMVNDHAT